MGYSLEYKEWTGENVEVEFSIKEYDLFIVKIIQLYYDDNL